MHSDYIIYAIIVIALGILIYAEVDEHNEQMKQRESSPVGEIFRDLQ